MITESRRELMFEGPSVRKNRILIADDNPAAVHLLRLALIDAQLDCELTVIDDGAEALARSASRVDSAKRSNGRKRCKQQKWP